MEETKSSKDEKQDLMNSQANGKHFVDNFVSKQILFHSKLKMRLK